MRKMMSQLLGLESYFPGAIYKKMLAVPRGTDLIEPTTESATSCDPVEPFCKYLATAPATCGDDIDVPLIVFVPPFNHVDKAFNYR